MKLVFTLFLFLSCFCSAHAMHLKAACGVPSKTANHASDKVKLTPAHFITSAQDNDSRSLNLPDAEEEDEDEIVKKHVGKILIILYQVYLNNGTNSPVGALYASRPLLSADSCKYIFHRSLKI